jgi:hypothetical protein
VTSTTQSATANALCVLDNSATTLFQSWNLNISNTAASSATLSNFATVLGTH